MRNLSLTVMLIFSILGCSPSSSDSPAEQSKDPIYGTWIYEEMSSSGTSSNGFGLKILENGTIEMYQLYAYQNSATSLRAYFRKNIGSFTRSGELMKIAYSYETCNPAGSENLKLKILSNLNQLRLSDEAGTISLVFTKNTSSGGNVVTAAAIEDVNCNILSKLTPISDRKIASNTAKSFFQFQPK